MCNTPFAQTLSKKAFLIVILLFLGLSAAQAGNDNVVASGTFVGQSDHITTGTVTILQTPDGIVVQLGDDFSLDGAPDPKIGFGKDGYDTSSTFTELQSKTGAQTYKVPDNIDPSQYNEIYIWCEKFSVPLGVAKLSK